MADRMTYRLQLATALTAIALIGSPALAEKKHGHGKKDGWAWQCPPGLAKKDPACVPPGQAKKHKHHKEHGRHEGHRHRVGEQLDLSDYVLIRDPGRYGYEVADGWRYYRDPYGIYQVDSKTRKILAIYELVKILTD